LRERASCRESRTTSKSSWLVKRRFSASKEHDTSDSKWQTRKLEYKLGTMQVQVPHKHNLPVRKAREMTRILSKLDTLSARGSVPIRAFAVRNSLPPSLGTSNAERCVAAFWFSHKGWLQRDCTAGPLGPGRQFNTGQPLGLRAEFKGMLQTTPHRPHRVKAHDVAVATLLLRTPQGQRQEGTTHRRLPLQCQREATS